MDFLSDRVSWKTLPGLPVGHPSQVQPASCSPRYRAWQDPEGRIYYEDLETGSTDKHLPGVLDSIYSWFMLIDVEFTMIWPLFFLDIVFVWSSSIEWLWMIVYLCVLMILRSGEGACCPETCKICHLKVYEGCWDNTT